MIYSAHQLLIKKFNLYLKIGVEIEFYIPNDIMVKNQLFLRIIKDANKAQIFIDQIRPEKGENQFELDIGFDFPDKLDNRIMILKKILQDNNIILDAKPYPNQPGSAMHFNISLHDSIGENIYIKRNDYINEFLSYSIGGLLLLVNQSMIFFAPHANSYRRFDNNFEVPKKICWGGNNRTAALRVLKNMNGDVRIEHRVAGVDCNHHLAITAIIIAIYYGTKNKINPPHQLYGNSFDQQYDFVDLSKSFAESTNYFNNDPLLKNYLKNLK